MAVLVDAFCDADKGTADTLEVRLFPNLAHERFCQGLAEFDSPAGYRPLTGCGRVRALNQEQAIIVHHDRPDTELWFSRLLCHVSGSRSAAKR